MGNTLRTAIQDYRTGECIIFNYANREHLLDVMTQLSKSPPECRLLIMVIENDVYRIHTEFENVVSKLIAERERVRLSIGPDGSQVARFRVCISAFKGYEKIFSPREQVAPDGSSQFESLDLDGNCHVDYMWPVGYDPVPNMVPFIPMARVINLVIKCGILAGVCPTFTYSENTVKEVHDKAVLIMSHFDFPDGDDINESGYYSVKDAIAKYEKSVTWLSVKQVVRERQLITELNKLIV